jgi:hypothetical protein
LISLNFRSVLEEEPDEDCIIPSLNLIENVKLSELRLLNEKEDGYLELCKEANGEKLDDKQKKNLKMVIQAMCSDDTKGILKFSLTPKLINSLNER